MRKSILGIALALGCGAAQAADLPVAAINKALGLGCTPTSCSGFYVGGQIGGVGTNANIIGNGINGSVFAGGGIPMVDVGYQYANGNWFFGAEAAAGATIASGVNINGLGGSQNGGFFYEIGKVGGNLSALLGTQQPITIPPKLANSLISPYVFVGSAQHVFANSSAIGWASGAGATFDINQNWFVDLKYMNVQYGASSNAAFNFNSENIVMVGFNYKFK